MWPTSISWDIVIGAIAVGLIICSVLGVTYLAEKRFNRNNDKSDKL